MTHDLGQLAPHPLELGSDVIIHLPGGLDIGALNVDASHWTHSSDRPELDDGRILSIFDYTQTWSWRERHPDGDELVIVLAGRGELELGRPGSAHVLPLEPGHCVIIPAGTWHRALIDSVTRLLFVTPTPARTEHEPA